MIGVINLDKPAGPTSHDMVGLVRRLTGGLRIGHAGTLDPLATGVLPILVGGATRLSRELTAGPKRYDAIVRLGFRSQTDDGEGPIEPGGPPPSVKVAEAALTAFVGTFLQRPPAFSARKQGGRTAHLAARRGTQLALEAREVTVHALRLLDATPGDGWLDLHLDLETGPGTYVRSIARDLGERLGCGGYLLRLRRTAAAGLVADDANTPAELEALAAAGRLADALIPVEDLVDLPVVILDADEGRRFGHGGELARAGDGRVLVRGPAGLLGIGTLGGGVLHPKTVLVDTPA
jgi:tRNA pseudouridine55 synthase